MPDMQTKLVVNLGGDLTRRAKTYTRSLERFSHKGRHDLRLLNRSAHALGRGLDSMISRYTGAIAGVGAAYVSAKAVMQSAELDQQLVRVRQTAGATAEQAAQLRKELFGMAAATGQSVDSLLSGFNDLVQSGQSWDQALATIKAINPAMAVTGSQAKTLASGLTVAAQAFDFDLSKPKLATQLLDKMTEAGRLGNAELEDLSNIFARVGVNAKSAGMSFDSTLGFVERLSLIEKNPERLATLADSTLRLFTNGRYMRHASAATGVNFFDAKGNRRAAFDVLQDISTKYKKLTTDAERHSFIQAAFGKADLDTIKGLRSLLSGTAVKDMRGMANQMEKAGGTIAKSLPSAMDQMLAQSHRLKAELRSAADDFSQPINKAITGAIKWGLDDKKLTGKEILGGGALAAIGGVAMLKGGSTLLKRFGATGGGVAMGKALEETAGVQPVYVVNMPRGGLGGGLLDGSKGVDHIRGGRRALNKYLSGRDRLLAKLPTGKAGLAAKGGLLAAAGAGGYAAGTWINKEFVEGTSMGDAIGSGIAHFLALLGNDNAKAAVAINDRREKNAELTIKVKAADGSKTRIDGVNANGLNITTETEHGARRAGGF